MCNHHRSNREWTSPALTFIGILLFAVAVAVLGCKRTAAPNPRSVYQSVRSKLNHGDVAGARTEVDTFQVRDLALSPSWSWRFKDLKAEILVRQDLNRDALTLLEQAPPPDLASKDVVVWRKMLQGEASYNLNRFGDAQKFLSEAETLASANSPELLGEVKLREGTLASLRNDLGTAETEYKAALRLARDQHDSFLEISCLGNLGIVATQAEHYDEAIDWNRSALKLGQDLGAQSYNATILGNIGWSYFEMGDYENALSLLQEADHASGRLGLVSAQVDWETDIGNVYYQLHDYRSAERAYQSAYDLAKSIDYELGIAQSMGNLAFVALDTGQPDSAKHYSDEFATFLSEHPNGQLELYELLIAGRIQELKHEYADAEILFNRVITTSKAKTSLRWAAESRLAEIYAVEGRRAEADRQFRRSIETIAGARTGIKTEEFRLSFLSSAIELYNDYIEFLISQNEMETALRVAEVSRAQTLAEGLGISSKISFPIPSFQPQLIAQRFGATLLFYWLGEKRSHLWVITRSGVSLFTLPPASEIESALKSYREALLGPRDVLEASNAQGIKLYETLVAPAQQLIAPGSRVIVLPDGGLYGLNFETLLNPKPRLHYWIEDAVIANANSLILLAASASKPPAKAKRLLLVGDPVSPSAEFPDLPQAANEMADVERYFASTDRTVLSRQQATATAYLDSKPAQYSFIHFVAHGTASRASPLDSAVILSRQGDSYKLYARDIVTQPLQANLVTVSACHGAGERTYSGEGLVGLTWAFLRAGAHGVIAALWEVNDNSTPELMDDLYAEIQKGSAPDAALHHAKLKLLNSGTVYQKPFYWAPFEIYLGH
jgi:CHAT domain-containing protein